MVFLCQVSEKLGANVDLGSSMLYNQSMGNLDHVDKEELERYFVEETPPEMYYAQFATEVTGTLACTNWTTISYEQIRQWGKEGRWMSKRAKFLSEKFPGLFEDARRQYHIAMQRYYEDADVMSPTELNQLSNTIGKLRDTLMNRSPNEESVDRGWITRDQLVEIVKEEYRANKDHLIATALSFSGKHE